MEEIKRIQLLEPKIFIDHLKEMYEWILSEQRAV